MLIKGLPVVTEQGAEKRSRSLRESFCPSTIFNVHWGYTVSFLQKRHFGGSRCWVGSGSPETRGFIYLFSHRANKATHRVPACGPWGPSEGREMRLPFRPCKQRLCELTGPREAAVSDTLVGQVRSMGSRGEVTCARGISRDGRGGAPPASEKRSSFFIRSVYSF